MKKQKHRWSVEDDIVALYLYRFSEDGLPLSRDDIGRRLGMGPLSLKDRIKNFLSLDVGRGLDHWAKQSEQVYHLYKDTPQEELRALVLAALNGS